MAQLPQFQSDDQNFQLMQNRWAAILNPVVGNPSLQSRIVSSVVLQTGSNTINHLLGHKLVGWRIVRQRAGATIYDTQDTNPHPELTLILVASAPVTVDIEVF